MLYIRCCKLAAKSKIKFSRWWVVSVMTVGLNIDLEGSCFALSLKVQFFRKFSFHLIKIRNVFTKVYKKVRIKLIQGLPKSRNGKLNLNGLHRDHPPATAISKPAGVRVKILCLGCDVWLANARLTETEQVDGTVFDTII